MRHDAPARRAELHRRALFHHARRNDAEEARWDRRHRLAIAASRSCVGDVELLLRARNADVEEAALLFQHGRIVELRYFAGLSIEETAEALGTSPSSVKRGWLAAKTFIRRKLDGK